MSKLTKDQKRKKKLLKKKKKKLKWEEEKALRLIERACILNEDKRLRSDDEK